MTYHWVAAIAVSVPNATASALTVRKVTKCSNNDFIGLAAIAVSVPNAIDFGLRVQMLLQAL